MKRFGLVVILSGFAALAGLSVPTAQAAGKCGDKGQPPCPLQGWMETNVQGPMEKGDLKKVAESLEKAARFAPVADWNKGDKSWEKTAKAGAAAAKAGDKKALKASCKTCHKAWRKEYKKSHRERAVK